MAENPLKKLLPKDPDTGPGIGTELGEKARQMNNARGALNPVATPEKSVVGKPSPMKPVKGPYGSQPGEKRIDTSFPDSPMPKFHKGGTVKETGPAILKKGEKVLTADQHGHLKNALGLAQAALSHEPADDVKPVKDVKEMHVRKTDNGGYIVKHIHKSFEHPDEEHVHPDMDALHDHMESHWGEPNDGENASEAEQDKSPGVVAIQKAIGMGK